MLATIIRDEFRSDERHSLAAAIEHLCNPDGTGEWASGGVYSFWTPHTHEVLYIGLAVDLAQRFRQHTGLLGAPKSGCKADKIDQYFETNQSLGYSALVQSPLNQDMCRRAIERYGDDPPAEIEEACNSSPSIGSQAISFTEGLLIQAYKLKHTRRPPWNTIAGGKLGTSCASKQHTYIVDVLAGRAEGTMEARRYIRPLAGNAT